MSHLSEAVNALSDALDVLEEAIDGDSNDAEHDAVLELADAARQVIRSW